MTQDETSQLKYTMLKLYKSIYVGNIQLLYKLNFTKVTLVNNGSRRAEW